MKKLAIAFIMLFSLYLVGCNKQIIDLNYKFNRAIISIGNETFEVEVDKWNDYEDTSIQIIAKDGTVYLTDLKNVILIND